MKAHTNPPEANTPWQQLKTGKVSIESALNLLVNQDGTLALDSLDPEVSDRFVQQTANQNGLPPVIPLLLWRCCYYLGCPTELSPAEIKQLSDRVGTTVKIIPITAKSYRTWFLKQNLKASHISSTAIRNPLTGEVEQDDIGEVAEMHLAKASDQKGRIKVILANALRYRASDIHLEPAVDGLRIRYRIDGILQDIRKLPLSVSRKVIVALKVMCNMDIAQSRRPQDGRIAETYITEGNTEAKLDMRVSTLPCVGGEKIVIRLLPQENPFSKMEDLGFSEKTLAIYKRWLSEPQGMIIFTGPTGSGKTSTLYTSLQAIATEKVNVTTVEEPVEYILPEITQTQVNEAAGMTFAAGLRAILRQDPDIIMLGEVRDPETAETAVRAALTGHLVLTTMHTNDASGSIPRLRDIGPDPGMISDALLGVIAQRLVRRVCPHCAQPHTPTTEELDLLGLSLAEANPTAWRKGTGCTHCFNTGYLGREAVIELMEVDDTVKQIIYDGTLTQLNSYLREINYNSFRMAAIEKVTTGITTVEELKRVLPYSAMQRKLFDRNH
jgi:type II secretory ATPase GspE/PulE/Tfp pilus assembly ATPase PilB-like protein